MDQLNKIVRVGEYNTGLQKSVTVTKAESVRVGQMVSWNSSGGRAEGKVVRILESGKYKVPNSSFEITGTKESPAAVIMLYRDGKPTKTMVGHKVGTLTVKAVAKGPSKDFKPNNTKLN